MIDTYGTLTDVVITIFASFWAIDATRTALIVSYNLKREKKLFLLL